MDHLKKIITSIDKDKHNLMTEFDRISIENVTYKKELDYKNRQIEELYCNVSQLNEKLDKSSDEINQNQKDTAIFRMQLERSNELNSDLNQLYNDALKENKRLQEEFILLSRDNQKLNFELVRMNAEHISLSEIIDRLKIDNHKVLISSIILKLFTR